MTTDRILVIGVGSIGERHVRCFQQTGRAEVAICEIDATLREQVTGRYGLQESYATFDAAVQAEFDAAVICTPAHLHVDMAIALAERGKHLLIEKPLSTNLQRVDELQAAVDRAGISLMLAYVLRVHPALSAMKQEIDSARFGRPLQLVAYSGQHFPTYRPAYREIYYTDRATGGGAIQDALTHMLNAGQWLIGPIDRVAADCAHQALEGVEVEDTVNVIARQGSVLSSYTLNQHQAPNESALTVVCERGTVRFEGHRLRWRWMTEPGGEWYDKPCRELERDDLFVAQAHHFLDVLGGTESPTCSLAEGIQTLRTILAILRAADTRKWVDLEEEDF